MKPVVLASASPRRRELLAVLIRGFEVVPAGIEEVLAGEPVGDASRLARAKALAVSEIRRDAVVIGSDTIVHDGDMSYGKPGSPAEAVAMLRRLRGREHMVVTGVALASDGQAAVSHSTARVRMSDLDDETIEAYAASGRPLDKAGAYAIQDEDVPTVASLEGCYCCVVGLPLWRLRAGLLRLGVPAREPGQTLSRCRACPERSIT